MYSKGTNSTGYIPLNREEIEKGTTATATVAIDGDKNCGGGDAPTPITFTGNGLVVTHGTERTPVFTFEYVLPYIDANTWTFTKTQNTGGIHNWHTPTKDDPPPPYEEGDKSHLIMIAVIMILAVAVAVNVWFFWGVV